MSEKKENKKKGEGRKAKFDKVREAAKKEKQKKVVDVKACIATREALEKDFKKDVLYADFESSTGKKFKIKIHRPSNEDSGRILRFSIAASKLEGSDDPDDLLKIQELQDELSEIASDITVDKNLDEDFWNSKVSLKTLINFVVGAVVSSQGVSDEEMRKFRK
jgi:hypothetical protein